MAKVSAAFTEKFGADWEEARKCDFNFDDNGFWNEADLWQEKAWLKDGLHYIDDDKWNNWVVDAPKGSKPWLIDFGFSQFGNYHAESLFEQKIMTSYCLAKHLKGKFNIGFGDYRKGENILESYDFKYGSFAKLAPLQLVIKDGIVYQLPQRNYNVLWYAEAVAAIEENADYKHPVRYARNEINIYWEYLLRDLGYASLPHKFDK